jgi:hypothetical protein
MTERTRTIVILNAIFLLAFFAIYFVFSNDLSGLDLVYALMIIFPIIVLLTEISLSSFRERIYFSYSSLASYMIILVSGYYFQIWYLLIAVTVPLVVSVCSHLISLGIKMFRGGTK